jgi:hypothetical protein
MLKDLAILAGAFIAATLVAELAGAANLGTALAFGQLGFVLALIYVMVWGDRRPAGGAAWRLTERERIGRGKAAASSATKPTGATSASGAKATDAKAAPDKQPASSGKAAKAPPPPPRKRSRRRKRSKR